MDPQNNDITRQELHMMLRTGIITPSSSAWSFPIVVASKKNGKRRFCVNYRVLNARMKADRFPFLRSERTFDTLAGFLGHDT